MHYAGLSADEALDCLMKSTLVAKLPATYADVAFLAHEYEYHWAMILAYGENYWLGNLSVSSELPAGYDEWEREYIASNKLADSSYEYQ